MAQATSEIAVAVRSDISTRQLFKENYVRLRLGELPLVLAAFTSTWTGVSFFGYKLSDLLLGLSALACIGLIISTKDQRLPRWVIFAAVTILLVLAAQSVIPTSWQYLASRHEVYSYNGGRTLVPESQVAVALQWLVALLILPLVTVASARGRPRFIPVMVAAWSAGACVSAAVAVSDYLNLSAIGTRLLGFVGSAHRENGLASHANNLGLACTVCVPIAVYVVVRRWQVGVPILLLLTAGSLLSGSRGAQAGVALGLLLTVVMSWKRSRQVIAPLVGGTALISVLLLLLNVQLTDSLSALLRFGSAPQSDSARGIVGQQALNDFLHRPLDGVGFSVITSAVNIYLQVLAAGGILLAGGMFVYWGGALLAGIKLYRGGDSLAGYLVCSVVVWLVIGGYENQLTDRYLYFPIAAIAALQIAQRSRVD